MSPFADSPKYGLENEHETSQSSKNVNDTQREDRPASLAFGGVACDRAVDRPLSDSENDA